MRHRLALLALAATAVWVILLAVAFNIALAVRLHQQADKLLRSRAQAVSTTVQARSDGSVVLHEPTHHRALDSGIWIYQGSRLIAGSPGPGPTRAAADRLVGHGRGYAQTPEPHAMRLFALPIQYDTGQVGTIVSSVNLDPYSSTTDTALACSISLAVLLLGGTYLVTRAVIGRALRPVAEMSEQATQWSQTGAAQRFGAASRPAELAALAARLDELLDHLATVLRHEQQQTAELSHELRTPLARITAEIDWLTTRPRTPSEQHTSHQAIAAAATDMQRICESLLSEARTRSGHLPGRCDMIELARDLARRNTTEHPDSPPITVHGTTATAGISATVAERILTPLLDNARRYATHTITIECTQLPNAVMVTVRDDGPGVPEDIGDAVFEPGRRADPTDDHDGAGLGLALARRLARAAGGDIQLAPTSPGATFTITLPTGGR
ncbi:sensor histidine kinase [Streptantibioticus ferralitis]|uniref:histidine kinase n=1 Tax=Streptantibioticus ferralitis TaxID=236510 RepID=A0ABT5YWJ4_9ACTN|nr:HAMP domain-containing sensor histidine kinase [Streptantibioticus ferralitis]MDF2255968.1 HAMP domain-containing sensor histidine kinase [Streptantibioticus ferralitis]